MRETIVDRAYAKTLLPPRKEDGHKGDFGKLLVLGGSVGYTGAPYLAASAAVHSGCGLVYLGVPESIWAVEAQKCVSAMSFPLPETDGRLCLAALDKMQDKLKGCDVLALGPGLGRGKETEQLVHALLWQVKEPLVLDADGLNALQGCTEKLDVRRGRVTILTPHDGEFARLTDRTLREIASSERTELASRFVCEHGCILVLKGHRTRIALPDGRMLVNTSGCSALSKGGSGDVLTGLIASLLCQGVGAAEAAALGVWLHGRAGELLAQEMTAYCASPRELVTRGLGLAFRSCWKHKKAKRNKAAASNDSAACLIEVKTGKAPPNESGALLPILTEDGKDHFLPGMRFGSSACLTTRFVRAKRAMTLGMTMRLLNISLNSQTRSLAIIVPRKMKMSARMV